MYGKYLKMERIARGYTQAQIAQIANITQAQVSYYEKDLNSPSIDIVAKMADFYGISIDELIGREIPPRTSIQIDQRHNKGKITNQF